MMMDNKSVKLIKIYWKRSLLHLGYVSHEPIRFYLERKDVVHNFEPVSLPWETLKDSYDNEEELSKGLEKGGELPEENSEYREVSIGISNVEGKILPQGAWNLMADCDFDVAGDILMDVTGFDRVFRYGQGRSYVTFFNCDDYGNLTLHTLFVKNNKKPMSRDKERDFAAWFANKEYSFFRGISHNTKKRILFFSQTSTKFSDNMKPVYDRLMERGFDKEYTIDIDLREEAGKKKSMVSNVKLTRRLASYDYIFVDNYVPIFTAIQPDNDVKVIQLWHAGVGFKSVGYARFGVKGSPDAFLSCHRRYTHAMVGNEGLIPVYSEVFGIPEDRFTATGMPRLEHFLDKDIMNGVMDGIYGKYPMLKEKRVILFAPTFRGNGQQDAYYDYEKLDLERLHEMAKETDSIIVFKWHGFIKDRMEIPEAYKETMIDISDSNLNDLMYVSNLLVTDYSSCYYDYLLLERPIIFYMYDEAIYSGSRGVGESMSNIAPGKVVHDMDEFLDALRFTDEIPKPASYMIDKCLTNGDYSASDRIIDKVFGLEREVTQEGKR